MSEDQEPSRERSPARAQGDREKAPSLSAAVLIKDAGWRESFPTLDQTCRRVSAAALASPEIAARLPAGSAEISFCFVGDAEMQRLNKAYRGVDRAANVLSFPAGGGGPGEHLLGDVVVAHGVLLSEAASQGKDPSHHLTHLLVHGVLHLLGYDHEEKQAAREMEALEKNILTQLGIPDPYRVREKEAAR